MYHAIIINQQKHGRLRKPRSDETPVPFLPVLGVSASAALFLLFHALVNYSAPTQTRLVSFHVCVRCGAAAQAAPTTACCAPGRCTGRPLGRTVLPSALMTRFVSFQAQCCAV